MINFAEIPHLRLKKRGKVRDIFEIDEKRLLVVSTDRISVFDRVLKSLIPEKGRYLNEISSYWFRTINIPNHFITNDVSEFVEDEEIKKRSMIVKYANPLPVECIVRGYLAGSALRSYKEKGKVNDIVLPEGLKDYAKLPEPIFTPTTKEDIGHDKEITFLEFKDIVGSELAQVIKELSIMVYEEGSKIAEKKGIIIADSKFEFGIDNDGNLILIDELLTPDSSRFWDYSLWENNVVVDLDKEFVRDYVRKTEMDILPDDIIEKTKERYRKIFEIICS
uniref:Phosphoribosylaminoimidazole-succinocarboxamide synthase n=1 Tax=candidate division WOR-3 bacterium TaxID=2052148 RepID=A0A7C4Y5X9_UNCW3